MKVPIPLKGDALARLRTIQTETNKVLALVDVIGRHSDIATKEGPGLIVLKARKCPPLGHPSEFEVVAEITVEDVINSNFNDALQKVLNKHCSRNDVYISREAAIIRNR